MSVCGIISPIVYLKILALTQLNVLVLFQGIKVTRNLPDLKYSLILRKYNTYTIAPQFRLMDDPKWNGSS